MGLSDVKRRVVITGATGRIGKRLRAHFGGSPDYELVLIDRDSHGETNIHSADLSRYDLEWTNLFIGADTVIHLAGDPRPTAPWQSVATNNIEASFNLFRVASACGVRRVIYASTLNTMEGYRFGHGPITADASPRPVSFYAASKLVCEAAGRQFAQERGLSVICLRLGTVQADRSSPSRDLNAWRQSKWLSGGDLCQAFEKAIMVSDTVFSVLPVVSDNVAMRWDLSETRRLLNYTPTKPESTPPPYLHVRIRALLGRAYKRLLDPSWREYWR